MARQKNILSFRPPDPPSRSLAGSRRRWSILRDQLRRNEEPCFGTEWRYLCDRHDCPLREECLALKARYRSG